MKMKGMAVILAAVIMCLGSAATCPAQVQFIVALVDQNTPVEGALLVLFINGAPLEAPDPAVMQEVAPGVYEYIYNGIPPSTWHSWSARIDTPDINPINPVGNPFEPEQMLTDTDIVWEVDDQRVPAP